MPQLPFEQEPACFEQLPFSKHSQTSKWKGEACQSLRQNECAILLSGYLFLVSWCLFCRGYSIIHVETAAPYNAHVLFHL